MIQNQKIKLEAVTKRYTRNGQPLTVLEGVDFEAAEGELVSIIGPSGCGKSTLLNIIAGLDQPTSGEIYLDGRQTEQRLGVVGYMQQRDLLFPWRTVIDNVVLGLELQGISRKAARQRAMNLTEQFGLGGFEQEYPYALSGGMKQRAAFLRTVLADQEVFLLDEPFGALDALTRTQIQEWLLSMWEKVKKTIVLVTHDVDEAIFLSDRVYVMTARPGSMRQVMRIELPRPRRLEMVTWPEFVRIKSELLSSIREGGGLREGEAVA